MKNIAKEQPKVVPVKNILIPETISLKLNNGVPVYLINAGTEEIMRIEFTFKAGEINELSPLLAATANMMLLEGSTYRTAEELNSLIDHYGIFVNQNCGKDRAGIVLFFLSKHLKKAIEIANEIIFNPIFPEKELNALLAKRLNWYLINKEKVQYIATKLFFESIFGKTHPYGRQVTEEDFESVNRSDLMEFHSTHYKSENMAIIISGNIRSDTIEIFNKYFGKKTLCQEHVTDRTNNFENILGKTNKKIFINMPEKLQSAIRIGSATINKQHSDYHSLKILNTILGGYFSSRLMKNIREDKGYTYGINSSVSSLEQSGYLVITTEVGKQNFRKAIDEIYKEIKLLQNVPVSKDEMTVVKNYMSGEMLRMFDGPFALAESFKSVWEFGLDSSYYHKLLDKIKTIEADEIRHLAKKYYNIDDLYEIIAGSE